MRFVEHAIFASAGRDRTAGYEFVARSPGICETDARELVLWSPTHDSMLDPDAESLNFHPLPSGAYCISLTTAAGWDCCGHGGQRVSTHCLIVPPEVLARFANNPFALIRTALANGALEFLTPPPPVLEPLLLVGGAAAVDSALLAELAVAPGPHHVAVLVQAARDAVCLALAGSQSPARQIAGLLNCLPPQCRLEFSFATGLKFSPRRPFRLVALSGDPAERLWAENHSNVIILDLGDDDPPRSMSLDGWTRLIERVLSTGRMSFLAAQLSKRRFELTSDDLPALGMQLLEDLEFAGGADTPVCPEAGNEASKNDCPTNENACFTGENICPTLTPPRAHAAHRRFGKSATAAMTAERRASAPSTYLDPGSPEVLNKLETLDDLVYEAIGGQAIAIERLQTLWPKLLAELGEDLLLESREQYLRFALSIWEECSDCNGVRDPARAVQALEVLCLLFGDTA
jgi:hypothetical protein